eukprot:jgi/Chlat1/1666/Chrsp127S01909
MYKTDSARTQSDSSGTDDDDVSMHGRPATGARAPVAAGRASKAQGHMTLEQQLKQLEYDALYALLRAFRAQASALPWGKENLIMDAKQALGISEDEYRDLRRRVEADEHVLSICNWKERGDAGPAHKKQRLPQPAPLAPTPTVRAPVAVPPGKRSGGRQPGRKGKGRGKADHETGPSEVFVPGVVDDLLGRRVRVLWDDEEQGPYWCDAVVTDYNAEIKCHCLTYNFGTTNESWEWLNVREMGPSKFQVMPGPPVDLFAPRVPSAPGSGTGPVGVMPGLLPSGTHTQGKRKVPAARAAPAGARDHLAVGNGHPRTDISQLAAEVDEADATKLAALKDELRAREQQLRAQLNELGGSSDSSSGEDTEDDSGS